MFITVKIMIPYDLSHKTGLVYHTTFGQIKLNEYE
ncbi:hypothetical protein NIASO_09255 [Niabella soli DSM 19437]|uniref:Uncharacterized protein n=1 Tax=Niabella soli DSM 19437 TaxID=929713 RepID=W0F3A5_9BACT|nr:hypothetical protein NIASO_09255 [Niabella soli DSM 19437]